MMVYVFVYNSLPNVMTKDTNHSVDRTALLGLRKKLVTSRFKLLFFNDAMSEMFIVIAILGRSYTKLAD